jgi:alpha-L-fucosidase 2
MLNFNLFLSLQWGAEPTNLGSLTSTLFDLIEKTWIPRGSETASLVYGTKGWVTHNEMNAFGHTGMKGGFDGAAIWSNCESNELESGTRREPEDLLSFFRPVPVSSTWLLAHAYDHFAHDPSGGFWRRRGYDMVKVHASSFLLRLLCAHPVICPPYSPTPSFGSTTSFPTPFIMTAPLLPPLATVLNSRGS